MGYSEHIKLIMNSLNDYSAEENKISSLYKTAIENAKNATAASKKRLNEQFYQDKNTAFADNARDERNLNNVLAARGLGFSGEAAQAKLNSNITLSRRLGDLTREKNAAELKYNTELADRISELSIAESEKLLELLKNKNQIQVDIAGMELDRENSEADRKNAKEMNDAKLKSDKEINDAKLKYDKDINAAKLLSDKEINAAKLQSDKDINDARLKADKELQSEKIAAEKEMFADELRAKYQAIASGGSSGTSSGGKGSGNGENAKDAEAENSGYIPSVTAKELAKQMISSSTENNRISSSTHKYMINKYLLELYENYNIDPDYYKELVVMLKSYGFEETSIPEMRTQVISYEAKAYYDNMYDKYYNQYVVDGVRPGSAHSQAKDTAANQQLAYIYKRCNNITEFKMCCNSLGIKTSEVQEYLNRINSSKAKVNGSSGGKSYITRQSQ